MRIMTVLSAGCLFAASIVLANVGTASEQAAYAPPANATPVYAGALFYPYGHPWLPYHAYRKDVRFGYVPVAPPPKICHGPTGWYGCFFYGPPYYVYPRPPLGCPGYAGFSGSDPNAYRTMVPPPIPTPSGLPPYAQSPMPAAEQLPAPPPRVSSQTEPIPPPPSAPMPK
ncbi:MAG: hypothetical protein WAU84_08555 [Thermoguttaceae bacterium]